MELDPRVSRKMAALVGMGFQRVESPPMTTDSQSVSGGRHKVTCTQPSMGTLVSVTAIHESPGKIQDAAAESFQEMERVVNLLNRYDPSSALSFLNVEGAIPDPPPELYDVMLKARLYHDASEGAFDSTVQPLVDLFRSMQPSESKVLEAVSAMDGSKVEMNGKGITLGLPGMGVTLDGIAKGFVVDRMAAVLGRQGLSDFLINAGGDIRSVGVREDGKEWRVGVQDPAKAGDLPDVIGLSNFAVATSGSYEIYFDRERTHHHIVSARTGTSPQTSQSVSVVAPTTLAADALATAVFVMEPERGIRFIGSFPQCACLIVDEGGRQWKSKGWRSANDLPNP
jgi:thiamine biosynthesis lipoprotein